MVKTQIPKSTQSEKQPRRKDRPRAEGGIPDNSPSAALEARRQQSEIFKELKEKSSPTRVANPCNIFVKEKRDGVFSDEQN